MITNLLQAIFNGILTGGVYAVVSVGLSLVFGIVDVVNFAQPEFLMMGMFVAYFVVIVSGLDPILASPLVFLVVFVFGAFVQKFLIQRVLNAPLVTQIFLTVAVAMDVEHSSTPLWGGFSLGAHLLHDHGRACGAFPVQFATDPGLCCVRSHGCDSLDLHGMD